MPILYNLRGYWRENPHASFKSNDYWDGRVILKEGGWVEGIAHDPESSYTGDRLLFGVFHEDSIIELFKFCPLAITTPFIYSITRKDDALRGEVMGLGAADLYSFGDSLISRSEFKPEMGDVDAEIKSLEEGIKAYKEEKMDEPVRICYDRIKELKDSIIKLRVICAKGNLISFDDREELISKFIPLYGNIDYSISNTIVGNYGKKVNKLVLDYDTLPEDDGLPFEM